MPKLRCIDSEDDISALCGSFALATKKSEKTDHHSLWASINVAANNVGWIDNPASVALPHHFQCETFLCSCA
jgi:hypothetical protein